MDSPYGRMTDSGQPTDGGPGARTRADLGLPVHRQTRAVSPQSESCICNGPTNIEAGTGPARRACKEPQSDPGPSRRAILTLPGPVLSGVSSARAARQGQRTGHSGPGGKMRSQSVAPRAASSHAQAVPDPRAPIRPPVTGAGRSPRDGKDGLGKPGSGERGEPLGAAADHPARDRRAEP